MKHFTSFIFALVAMFCMAASASAALDTSKTYYLKSSALGLYASVPATAGTVVAAGTSAKSELIFHEVSGGYTIKDASNGNYIGVDSWNCVASTTPVAWEVTETEGGYYIKNTTGTYSGQWMGGQSGKTKFYNNNPAQVLIELEVAGTAPSTTDPDPDPDPAPGPLENVALHNLAGNYLCINGDMNVGTTEFKWDLTAINNLSGAYTVKQHGASYWVNSGSSGYLSKASGTENARHFYFYEVTSNDGSTINASLVTTPKSGKNYLVGVSNVTPGYHGFYIVYGQLAKNKDNRLDVVTINTSAVVDGTYAGASGSTVATIPTEIEFTTSTASSNGAINFDKVIWTLEGHTFDLTVPAAGYATLFFDEALAVPTGVTAYTLAENAGGWLDATVVTEIPANTGVVLQATAGDYNFEFLETADAATSCLSGTLTEIDAPADCYVLGKEDGEVGFYKYTGKLAANKAYYVASTSESNIRVNFDGMATALDNIVSAPASNEIFDLQGRRVLNAKNGLYIVNGKKVIR